MKNVVIEKTKLYEILVENRKKHIALYEETIADFVKAYRKKVKRFVKLAKAGDPKDFEYSISLPRPQSSADQYDRLLQMLSLDVNDRVELDVQEFENYVRDNWSWSASLVATSSFYKGLKSIK